MEENEEKFFPEWILSVQYSDRLSGAIKKGIAARAHLERKVDSGRKAQEDLRKLENIPQETVSVRYLLTVPRLLFLRCFSHCRASSIPLPNCSRKLWETSKLRIRTLCKPVYKEHLYSFQASEFKSLSLTLTYLLPPPNSLFSSHPWIHCSSWPR